MDPVISAKTLEDYLLCIYYKCINEDSPCMSFLNPTGQKQVAEYYEEFCRKFTMVYGGEFSRILQDKSITDHRSLKEIEVTLDDSGESDLLYAFASSTGSMPDRSIIAGIRSSCEYGMEFLRIFNLTHNIIPADEPDLTELIAEDSFHLLAAAHSSFPEKNEYVWNDRSFGEYSSSMFRTEKGDHRFTFHIPAGERGKLRVQLNLYKPGEPVRVLQALCAESNTMIPIPGEIDEQTKIVIRIFKTKEKISKMKIVLPILGLQNVPLEKKLSQVQELQLCGLQKLPNVDYSYLTLPSAAGMDDLLHIISNIFHCRYGVCVKAYFEFPSITDPRIFKNQRSLASLGLGLLTCLHLDYLQQQNKKNKNKFQVICLTGVLKTNPSLDEKKQGDILSEETGKIPEKLAAFISYIKEEQLQNKSCAFFYSGPETEAKLTEMVRQAGLAHLRIKRFSNFNTLMAYITGQKTISKTTSPPIVKRSLFWILAAAVFSVAIIISGIFLLPGIISSNTGCGNLVRAVKSEDPIRISKLLKNCSRQEEFEAAAAEAFRWALTGRKSDVLKQLINGGVKVDVNAYHMDKALSAYLENVTKGGIMQMYNTDQLEEEISHWGTYTENLPVWSRQLVTAPALHDSALQYTLGGGAPYSNVHGYLNLAVSPPDGAELVFQLSFRFQPETTYNNKGTNSLIQAIEFSLSIWGTSRRWEMAVQWENVGENAPHWRYWDPHKTWLDLGIPEKPAAGRWHSMEMFCRLSGETLIYQGFTFNEQFYKLDIPVDSVSVPENGKYISLCFQLDGNYQSDPYSVIIDNVNFRINPQFD